MRARVVRSTALLAAGILAATAATAASRVLAIGDIHGSLEGLTSILREAGLTDTAGSWTGGDAQVVQTGDFTDRGGDVRRVMDLLIGLEKKARADRGRFTVLLGNHELLNLMRHDADVVINPEIYASFAGGGSADRRQRALGQWRSWRAKRAAIEGLAPLTTTEEEWLARRPPGFVEYHASMAPGGRYGRWLRQRPVVHQIDDTIFVHGGLAEAFARLSVDRINELHRLEIAALDETLNRLERKGVVAPYSTWEEIVAELDARLAVPDLKRQRELIEEARARLDRFSAITGSLDSPLWYRGYALPPRGLEDEALASLRDLLAETHGARHFVVAHSPFHGSNIAMRLGSFFLIDTGMLASVYAGRPSALEITEAGIAAIYPGERQVLIAATPPSVGGFPARGGRRSLRTPPTTGRIALAALPAAETGSGREPVYERPPRRWLDREGEPLPFDSPEEVEDFLSRARILSQQPVGEGKTGAVRLELELGGVRARGIFHDIDDRRDPTSSGGPIRLSGGTTMLRFRDSYSGQSAAYHLARLMGLDLVPPTVIREVDGVEGSVQLWMEGATNLTSWKQENPRSPPHPYYQHQLQDMRVFDALVNNKDRNTGNILWTADWNMWWIDHTRTFAQDATLFRPELVQRCSRDLLQRIKSLDEKQAIERLKPYLSTFEVKAMFKRRKRLLRYLDDRIQKLGEERVLFDYGDPIGLITVGTSPADAV